MFARVNTAALIGLRGISVSVEVDVSSQGLPSFAIVGLGDSSVRESRERLRAALKNMAHAQLFQRPITINLSPSHFAKSGTHYDLAMAIGLVCAEEPAIAQSGILDASFVIGELALDGSLTSIDGVLPLAMHAKSMGFEQMLVPAGNVVEASLAGIDCYGFTNLRDATMFIRQRAGVETGGIAPEFVFAKGREDGADEATIVDDDSSIAADTLDNDFADVKGQEMAKRGALIAAAGMHNILLIGPPGSGKTMIANRIPHIMPSMTMAEALETTSIYSLAGWERVPQARGKDGIIVRRPFIAPHHTASSVAIIGGGANAMPGSVSLAHNGVLFLDEFLEFGRTVVEVLRQPMESGTVTVSRSKRVAEYPANFMLVAACNPCPCGYYQDSQKECVCSPPAVIKYRSKLSGPILDRIDLHVKVHSISVTELMSITDAASTDTASTDATPTNPFASVSMKAQVQNAYNMQRQRFHGTNVTHNSQMTSTMIKEVCVFGDDVRNILHKAVEKYALTARAYDKVLRVARTVADLEQSTAIKPAHVLEALQYRLTQD